MPCMELVEGEMVTAATVVKEAEMLVAARMVVVLVASEAAEVVACLGLVG